MTPYILRIGLVSALTIAVSGCATQSTRDGGSYNPFCTLAGMAVGGGGAAAVSLAAGPVGAGMFAGALLGTLACSEGPAETMPVAAAPMAPSAPPVAAVVEMDSDGDGVIDRLDRCPDTPAGRRVDANGCPEILLTLTGINFKFDSAVIEPVSEPILNDAVEVLNRTQVSRVRIVGHTDSVGTDAYNVLLSQRRAAAVRAYLVTRGIDGSRLETDGRGESEPVESNTTAEGRFQNRRVEFRVPGDGSAETRVPTDDDVTAAGDWNSLEQPVSRF